MDPQSIGHVLSGMGSSLLPTIMKWTGITILGAFSLGVFYMVFLFFQYNIAVHELIVCENSDSTGEKKKWYIKGMRLLRARRA